MRIKRWVCALLCLALLLGVLPEVRAAEVSGNFEYKLEQSGTVTITGCRDLSLTELVIPAEIEGRPVHAIARPCAARSRRKRARCLPRCAGLI